MWSLSDHKLVATIAIVIQGAITTCKCVSFDIGNGIFVDCIVIGCASGEIHIYKRTLDIKVSVLAMERLVLADHSHSLRTCLLLDCKHTKGLSWISVFIRIYICWHRAEMAIQSYGQ